MTPTPPSAKQRVIEWVRSKNPQKMELKLPYSFQESGFSWKLIGVNNNFAKGKDSLVFAEYENQYGHIRQIEREEILGSDMGLQELLIALRQLGDTVRVNNRSGEFWLLCPAMRKGWQYDLTKNLHNQPDKFYEDLLPLLPTP